VKMNEEGKILIEKETDLKVVVVAPKADEKKDTKEKEDEEEKQ